MAAAPKRRTRVMEVRAEALKFDASYQRAIIPARVKRLRTDMDLDAIGVITVSERDGELYVVDGQHRVRALVDEGLGEWKVKCNVYSDMEPEEEAGLFRTMNDTRRIAAFDDFRAGLVERDPECVAIARICERAGLRVDQQAGPGHVTCVGALRSIYRRSPNGKAGALLTATLDLALASWGRQSSAVEGKVLEGIAIVLDTYGEEVDLAALTKKLAKVGGQASGLLGMARGLREHRGGTVAQAVAVIVVDLYNKGRRAGSLAPL